MATGAARKNVLVLGGGVSGLSSAYFLQKSQNKPGASERKVYLWEKEHRAGGWINSFATEHGATYEIGPRSLRAVGPSGRAALELADELHLRDEVVFVPSTDVSARNRFIYVKKKLHRLPNDLGGVLRRRDPFSKSLAYYGLAELFKPRNSTANTDESIYDFVKRRLGDEVAGYLIDALTRGIFAGDSRKLSIEACLPQLKRYERDRGSILRGALFPARSKPAVKPTSACQPCALIERAVAEKWSVWSFKNGLQTFTDHLCSSAIEFGANVSLGTECTRLEFMQGGGVKAYSATGELLNVDHVVSGLYAPRLASLIAEQQPELATLLRSIPAVNVAVVNLEYPISRSSMPVQGFGHLVPSCESSDVLGIIYDSCVFPQHDRKDQTSIRFTCMMGGAWFEQLFGQLSATKASTFEQAAIKAVREQLGVTAHPVAAKVSILKDCIPQYVLGHLATLKEIDELIAARKLPLSLIGSSYRGVAVGDCIAAAESLSRTL